jgi:hypothetical protein
MAFITYVLLYSFYKGIGSISAATFSPDVITQTIWRCLMLQFIEAGVLKFSANIISVHVPFLDCFSLSGYKYVPLVLNTLASFGGKWPNLLISLYTSLMLAYFTMKTAGIAVPAVPNESHSSMRLLIITGFGAIQFLITAFMSLF